MLYFHLGLLSLIFGLSLVVISFVLFAMTSIREKRRMNITDLPKVVGRNRPLAKLAFRGYLAGVVSSVLGVVLVFIVPTL